MNFIIPAILTFSFGLLLWLIKRDRYLLVYDLTESDVFPSNSRNGKYFIIKVKNKGNKAIEDSLLKLSFRKGEIQKHNSSDADLISNETVSSSNYSCTIPLLNPKEIIQFTFTTESNSFFEAPNIQIRGKGVNGKVESSSDYTTVSSMILPIIVSIFIAFSGTTFIQKTFFKDDLGKTEILEQLKEVKSTLNNDSTLVKLKSQRLQLDSLYALMEKGNPEREDIIFTILNKSGLSDLFPEFINTISETTYKNTAYFIFHNYLTDLNRKENYIKAFNYLIEIKNITSGSKGIIYYLVYKIHLEQNDGNEAMIAIKECEKTAPLMFKYLMDNDKYYDIQQLRKALLKKEKKTTLHAN